MLINFFLWLATGLFVGLISHLFKVNKKKDLEPYLLVGPLAGLLGGMIANFLIWPVAAGEINVVAILISGIFAFFVIKKIDFFFHVV